MGISAAAPTFIVHEFAKNKRESIRAILSEYEGRPVADIRVWVPRKDGTMVATPKGLTFDRSLLPEVENAVRALCAAATTPEPANAG